MSSQSKKHQASETVNLMWWRYVKNPMDWYGDHSSFLEECANSVGNDAGWSREQCRRTARETYKFLFCKSVPIEPKEVTPTPDIALVWKECVTKTSEYRDLCERIGKFIPFDCEEGDSAAWRQKAEMRNFIGIHATIFDQLPHWTSFQELLAQSSGNQRKYCRLEISEPCYDCAVVYASSAMDLSTIKRLFQILTNIPADDVKLMSFPFSGPLELHVLTNGTLQENAELLRETLDWQEEVTSFIPRHAGLPSYSLLVGSKGYELFRNKKKNLNQESGPDLTSVVFDAGDQVEVYQQYHPSLMGTVVGRKKTGGWYTVRISESQDNDQSGKTIMCRPRDLIRVANGDCATRSGTNHHD